jgi:hypothetical protein
VDGYGEISSEHVRLLLPHASLRPVYVDATTGQPVDVGDGAVPAAGDGEAARQRVLAMLRSVVHVDEVEDQHDPSAGWRVWSTRATGGAPAPAAPAAAATATTWCPIRTARPPSATSA